MPNTITPAGKKLKLHHRRRRSPPLIPGLPDHIAETCLSKVRPEILYSVCKSWRNLIYSPNFSPFLSIYVLFVSNKATDLSDTLVLKAYDPVSEKWRSVPAPPDDPPVRLLLRHPSFISRKLPVQSVCVNGKLVILAATTENFAPALSSPVVFNPLMRSWSSAPPLSAARRWCVVGACGNSVYVASGVGFQYNTEVARSVERLEFLESKCENLEKKWNWRKLGLLKDGKFSREAIEAVSFRGKLCMVNVKGDFRKQGLVYDVENDTWQEMPEGMLAGWRGPAASMKEESLYVVDESKGILKMYDSNKDCWEEVMECEKLQGAEHMVAEGGRVCVVCSGGVDILVVDVAANPPKLVVVETPEGLQATSIHVLPRMSCSSCLRASELME
ncbi:F-box/kelch-repeat protein SKIP25 [Heracleum sosnowskyi]|uniref:F-box/kelch-repeat protein SKIP25 n=1 Tax=Heracleum sosnowskyi TaxID=360622 RepID=A0AAD8MGW9_9APIA|nr:F-box/kelch-repeat protein SKIP25 [Heracleum sosnowskyi]